MNVENVINKEQITGGSYDNEGPDIWKHTDEELFMSYVHKAPPGGNILEVGCGKGGRIGTLEASAGTFGVDLSEPAILSAKRNFPETAYGVSDSIELPFSENMFDFVYSLEAIENATKPKKMLDEMIRVVKPGGYCFVQINNYPIKYFYDLISWMFGKKESKRARNTDVSRFSFVSFRRLVKRRAILVDMISFNVSLGRSVPLMESLRRSRSILSLIFGQKTIIVFKKHSSTY